MFFKFRKVIFLCLGFWAFFSINGAWAQDADTEDPNWFWDKEIATATFENLVNVKRNEVSGITSNYIGKKFTEELYAEITDRLYALDVFEEISPYAKPNAKNKNKIDLVFAVVEKPIIASITFSGNKKIRNNDLRGAITMKVDDIFISSQVLVEERALRDFYLQKGYTGVKVTHSTNVTPTGVDVTFTIDEGQSTIITKIAFQGTTIASDKTLKSKLTLKEKGILKDGAFQRATLEADRQLLAAYYQERGYADVEILDVLEEITPNPEKDRNDLKLTFVVSEGMQYTLGNLTLQGNYIFSTEKLMTFFKIKKGDVLNMTKIQEGMQGVVEFYAENGYMTNQYFPNVERDADTRVISYTLTIYENSRSHIENIIINGNSKTKDYVILRELGLEEGEVFSRQKLMDGMRNLYNTRYFSSVVPEPVQGSEENLVDLVISVEEQSTTSVNFGLTFSGVSNPDDFPISLFGSLESTNLFGEGRSAGINLSLATDIQSLGFSYGQSWIGDQPISLSESLTLSHSVENALHNNFLPDGTWDSQGYYYKYNSWGASLGSSVGRRWNPSFAILTVSGGLTNSIVSNQYDSAAFVPLDTVQSRSVNSVHMVNSLWGQVSLDDRDINYDPSKGWFASQRFAWYGLIPKVESEFFLRSDTKLEGYLTLFNLPVTEKWSFKMILAAYSGVTFLFPLPNSLFSTSNKVYIDGMFNGRGWQDIYNTVRGKAMWSNIVELRFPVIPGILGIDFFFDAVAVKETPASLFNDLQQQDFYCSFGPGIRFLLPQFPLRLLFANKFKYNQATGKTEMNGTPMQFVLSFSITNK